MTMTKEYTKLDKTFNLTPEVEVVEETSNVIQREKPSRLTQDDIEKDYEYTRGNLYSIIEKGQEAINGILEVAQDSDMPRAYEVAGGLIKNLQDNAKDMLYVHDKKKRITADDPKARNIKTQNNVFVGSTKDLLKAIKEDDVKTIDVDPDATT